MTDAIGTAATVASVSSFTPQVWKIVKTGDTSGISRKMYLVTVTGFALWLVFGWRLGSIPLMVANGLCLLLSGIILLMTLLPSSAKEGFARYIDLSRARGIRPIGGYRPPPSRS